MTSYLLRSSLLLTALFLPLRQSHAQQYVLQDDCAIAAIKGKRTFNLVHDDRPVSAADMDLPASQYTPPTPALPHPVEVAESARAYSDGHYADAASLVEDAAKLEPADPTVLDCYARALYRGPGTRAKSYPVYQRLIRLLDVYGHENSATVAIYTPFLEAYFKLATLQLDNAQWAAASYNLSRASLAMQAVPSLANPGMREQILQYQTECFAHLGNAYACRYFARRTLRFFPHNQYVKPYLAALAAPLKTATKLRR